MIKYALQCEHDHKFEGWFSNSAAYDDQVAGGLVECPTCGSAAISKALMAPAISTSRRRDAMPESKMREMATKVREHIRTNYDYVGEDFATEARAMHDGDKPERLIYGEASPKDSKALADDGVPVAPLPDEMAPTPPKKLN
jgi:hypothetical protein